MKHLGHLSSQVQRGGPSNTRMDARDRQQLFRYRRHILGRLAEKLYHWDFSPKPLLTVFLTGSTCPRCRTHQSLCSSKGRVPHLPDQDTLRMCRRCGHAEATTHRGLCPACHHHLFPNEDHTA